MLAAIPHDIPLREHSHLDFQHSNQSSAHPDALALEEKLCPGCKKSVVNEQGGLVVAFGQSFFHVDCFKCAKCRNQVTADTNLLLLSDGSPICANCSYSCNICHLPILDEAIMTGDDSYHAHCFKCKVCSNRIDELVFAKTSQGIYCMNCHNERMIKIRKHAQKKAERERANGGSGSSKSREHEARNFHRDQEKLSADGQRQSNEIRPPPPIMSSRSEGSRPPEPSRQPSTASIVNSVDPLPPSYSSATASRPQVSRSPSSSESIPASNSISVTIGLPQEQLDGPQVKSKPLSVSDTVPDSLQEPRTSNGSRPLNGHQGQDFLPPTSGNLRPSLLPSTEGLSVTSRRDKRRSINPGLSMSQSREFATNQVSVLPSRQASLPVYDGSPTGGQSQQLIFTPDSRSQTPSRSNSLQSSYSSQRMNNDQSRSSSSDTHSNELQQDDTITIKLPANIAHSASDTMSPATEQTPSSVVDKSAVQRSSASLSPTDTAGFASTRRTSLASNRSLDAYHSSSNSRSVTPSPADVPRDIDSGTDTDADNGNESDTFQEHDDGERPPALPPKDGKGRRSESLSTENTDDFQFSESMQSTDVSEYNPDSLSMQRLSHTTFIAPALPPIRFSMNAADFSELLNSVGGLPPLKSIDTLAKLTKQKQDNTPSTPPPTASSFSNNNQSQAQQSRQSTPENGDNDVIDVLDSYSANSPISGQDESAVGQGYTVVVDAPAESKEQESANQPSGPRRASVDADVLLAKLRESLATAKEQGSKHLKIDIDLVDGLMEVMESRNAQFDQLRSKVDGMNRESKLFIAGLTVAQEEYDRELKARRDAEAEVTRLRVLLSGQAVRLTALSGDSRREEIRQQLSKELNDNLSGLEHDLSRLKVERDMTLAEVEELSAKRPAGSSPDAAPTNLGRSLTRRLENIRSQYQRELIPLTEQKEALNREIAELRAVRDVFLEETTVLNARNEELAQLSAVYARRMENSSIETPQKTSQEMPAAPFDIVRTPSQTYDDSVEPRSIKSIKSENELNSTPKPPKFKWPGSKAKETASPSANDSSKGKAHIEHNFQQLSILRFTRCDHCGDKMWGSQLRCTICSTSIHVRCIANVHIPCAQQNQPPPREELVPLPPSMFGRDLTEQVMADSRSGERDVPVIVEKCIQAVEERGLDYEGIYRKTGGSGQTKAITQLFERADYASFDLCDWDRFNDICSITSVLKTYFRSLPDPLLTYDLHDQFTASIGIKDAASKFKTLSDLIHKLPDAHYYTLRMLMLHLHRVLQRSDINLMTARNLGVVFGPTLMRSRDPGAEFSDMAGKALFVEWLVEKALEVFNDAH
ncbi:hypothetical protein D9613_000644 [Agrocybe pediades]|uniref:RhoGAP-domain-containing protein n=1 Tax=Agrocybe pediades TaxID=84607 RepID=A0A8H4QZW3_9AGAR|nr:hypothetical protein D9613_000644 [Agrocybe pediades]